MNSTELQSHFYKRFNAADAPIALSRSGLPVSLMGRLDLDTFPSIGCRLSMCIRAAGCAVGGRAVTITSTKTDMRRVYDLDRADSRDRISAFLKRAEGRALNGCELLIDSTIPDVIDPHTTYTAAVCKTVFRLSHDNMPSPLECADLCASKNDRSAYVTEFAAEKGYCVYTDGSRFTRLPLPMTGYRFIIAAEKEPPGLLSLKTMQKTFSAFKRVFPHITSFSEITNEMLDTAAIKSYSVKTCARYIVSECERARAAAQSLKSCSLRLFAEQMNRSFLAQKHLCADNDPRVFLCDALYSRHGIIGARICEHGVMAIIDDDYCDEAVAAVSAEYEAEFGKEPILCIADSI